MPTKKFNGVPRKSQTRREMGTESHGSFVNKDRRVAQKLVTRIFAFKLIPPTRFGKM